MENSFGFLIPSECKSNIYGSLFDSSCFPELFENQSLTIMVKKEFMLKNGIEK